MQLDNGSLSAVFLAPDHVWVITAGPTVAASSTQHSSVQIILNKLTLNIQMDLCRRFLPKMIFGSAVIISTKAGIDIFNHQDWSGLLVHLVISVPGVVGHWWVWMAAAEQRNWAALQDWTGGVHNYCCFFWRNYKMQATFSSDWNEFLTKVMIPSDLQWISM